MWKKRNRCNSSVSDHKKTVTLHTLGTQGFTKSVTVVTVVTEKNRYTLPGEIFFSGMKMERTGKKAEYNELLLFQAKKGYIGYRYQDLRLFCFDEGDNEGYNKSLRINYVCHTKTSN